MSAFDIATTTYIPDKRKSNGSSEGFEPVPEGKYYASIVEVKRKFEDKLINSRDEQGIQHMADLLEVTYKIDGNKHPDFKNRRIWSNAIWVWKDKNHIKTLGHDTLMVTPNEGSNERYAKFLEVAGYELDKKIVEVEDSQGKTVKREAVTLPVDIDLEECQGKALIIQVKNYEYTNKSGEEVTGQKELGLYPVDQSYQAEIQDDDLPF